MALQIVKTINHQEEFAAAMKQGCFLVVDDFDAMRKVTINQLRQLGATRILEAGNGIEALRVLARHPVTFVLADWNMPVMNGLDLLLTIRSSSELFRLPVMMITAEAERNRVMQAIQVGVSELLVKPYTAARLAERIRHALQWSPRHQNPIDPVAVSEALGISVQLMGNKQKASKEKVELLNLDALTGNTIVSAQQHPSAPLAQAKAPAPVVERPSILIVDDTPDNLQLLSQLFKDEYRVRIAHNGEKALKICHSDTPPDLILLDVMMPDMDGFEVASKLREHPASEHIPVIFVTALTGEEDRLKGMELGAVDFVTKPINPDALRIRVRNFMRYVDLHRRLQADFDGMMAIEQLKADVEHITRHDLKGPLASVIGLVQGLADAENMTASQRQQLQLVEEAAMQTLNMVNLSNELYKMETGRFVLNPQPVEVAQIIRRIADAQRKVFAAKNLTIAVGTPHGLNDHELRANGDTMLCYSLFQNLMKNACEAAPPDSTVTITIRPGDALQISIENPGAIPQEIRHDFFGKFVTAGKQGGTGLGTYSAKLLTEAQQGSISMETSDQENSTKISVNLPSVM